MSVEDVIRAAVVEAGSAAAAARDSVEVRNRLIAHARGLGATYRALADATGLTHMGVRDIVVRAERAVADVESGVAHYDD
jgi:hypothetical protein